MSAHPPPDPLVASLTVCRTIRASPERLFDAWTEPSRLMQWWGPAGVTCISAEVDLRVDGRYRIGNQLPQGDVVWIVGVFERISPPHLLVYSWQLEHLAQSPERVTVRFDQVDAGTQVTVLHERIADMATRQSHDAGWQGCLQRLELWLSTST